jgi:hypothetical protein
VGRPLAHTASKPLVAQRVYNEQMVGEGNKHNAARANGFVEAANGFAEGLAWRSFFNFGGCTTTAAARSTGEHRQQWLPNIDKLKAQNQSKALVPGPH